MAYNSAHTGPEIDAAVQLLGQIQDARDSTSQDLIEVKALAAQVKIDAGQVSNQTETVTAKASQVSSSAVAVEQARSEVEGATAIAQEAKDSAVASAASALESQGAASVSEQAAAQSQLAAGLSEQVSAERAAEATAAAEQVAADRVAAAASAASAAASAQNAEAVVTGGMASVTSGPGLIPLADAQGKIDADWMPDDIARTEALQAVANTAAGAADDAAETRSRTSSFLLPSPEAPNLRDDGSPLQAGDRYFNAVEGAEYIYTESGWSANDSLQALNDYKAEIADPSAGASQVGWDQGTVAEALIHLKSISNVAALALYSGPATSCWIRDSNQFGQFAVDPLDTASLANAITVVVDPLGRRWKRKYCGSVNIRWAGAKGDGSDDAAAIQKCLDLFRSVYIPEGDFWVTSLQFKGGKLHGPGSDAVLRKIGEGPMIQAHGSLGEALLLSAAPVIGNNVISVLSGASFNPGEWAILESMDPVYPGDSGGRAGEIVRVQTHVGNTITLHAPIIFTYTLAGGVRLRKVNWMDSPVLKDFQIRMNPTANADLYNDQADAIDLMFCVAPTVERVYAREGKQAAVRLTGCVEGLVDSCRAEDLASADDDVTGGYGYGVHERGANLGLIVRGGRYSRVRSAYTTGFGFNSIYPHGVSVNALVTGNEAIDTFSGSFTTHPSGIYTTISDNTIHGCRSSAINVRAKGTMVLGNMISKTMGAGVLVVYDQGAVSDAVISNNTLMDTNQGITPSGEDHRNYGAIQDSGPNSVITDNKIFRCGGPAIRLVSTRDTTLTGNKAYDPCQKTTTRKYAFGADVAGLAGDYILFSNNHCSSSDGKVTNLVQKPNNAVLEGTGNTAKGITGSLYAGESANYYLTGSNGRSNKNGRGRAVTVRLSADNLNLEQDAIRSSIIVVWAEAGSSSDNMSSITGGFEGDEVLFRCVDGNSITIVNGADSTNNIRTSSGSNLVLSGAYQIVRFVKYNSLWIQC
ncbi:right-handed parallel beta-helix repeat-containing protein [Pseudomonas asiatica]|uniref:right-handed parallel beta-helix repeat-containing protein n=1 Tax=Pseudomonas asiatica TaxID=2219225 RepID=UPI0023651F5B|nr:right-handed parallel beta-helix repeat-containing protein [Pseudomonas asiatica]MDD1982351.1 right-handed parallel beta-helix repeat-containing protein [Pseudomonas asiatica]